MGNVVNGERRALEGDDVVEGMGEGFPASSTLHLEYLSAELHLFRLHLRPRDPSHSQNLVLGQS